MDTFDEKLKDALSKSDSAQSTKGQKLAAEAAKRYAKRLKQAGRYSFIWHLLLAALLIYAIISFEHAEGLKPMIQYMLLIIFALAGLIVIKLWYWIVNSKLGVLHEMERLRYEMLSTGLVKAPDEQTMAVLSGITAVDSIRRREIWTIVLVGALVGIVMAIFLSQGWTSGNFIGAEKTIWTITSSESVEAQSDIVLKKWPEGKDTVTLRFPYEESEAMAITLDGNPLQFDQIEPGVYRVELPPAWRNIMDAQLQIKWRFPFQVLPDGDVFRANLVGLIPVETYRLIVKLESDAPFQIKDMPESDRIVPFRGHFRKPTRNIGTCGLLLETAPAPPSTGGQ